MSEYNYKEDLKADVLESYENREFGGMRGKQYLKLSSEEASYFKVKSGKNAMDIIPFIFGTDLFPNKKKGKVGFMLDIFVHKGFNQSWDKCLCMKKTYGKACPICEERERLIELDADEHEKRIKELAAKRRCIVCAVNLKSDEEDPHNGQVQIFDETHYYFMKELLEEAAADDAGNPIDFTSLDNGFTVLYRASLEKIDKAKFFKYKTFGFEEREEQYPEGIIKFGYSDDLFDHGAFQLDTLLVVPTYQEVEAMLRGESATSPVEEKENKKEPPKKGRQSRYNDDDDDEEKSKSSRKNRHAEKEEEKPEAPKESKPIEEHTALDSCPYKHTFGKDNMNTDDCTVCRKKHIETFKECIMQN